MNESTKTRIEGLVASLETAAHQQGMYAGLDLDDSERAEELKRNDVRNELHELLEGLLDDE